MIAILLSRIVRPPARPLEADGSGPCAEKSLGMGLPDDFKDFIRIYGSGRIGRFMPVLNPFAKSQNLNLLEQSRERLGALRYPRDLGEPNPYTLYPESGDLLPVAIADNGDIIHWLICGYAADWVIAVNESGSLGYEQLSCKLTAFLKALLNQSPTCGVLPTVDFDRATEFVSHSQPTSRM